MGIGKSYKILTYISMAKKRNLKMQVFPKAEGRGKYKMNVGQGRTPEEIEGMIKEYRETGSIDEKRWARR